MCTSGGRDGLNGTSSGRSDGSFNLEMWGENVWFHLEDCVPHSDCNNRVISTISAHKKVSMVHSHALRLRDSYSHMVIIKVTKFKFPKATS